MQRTDVTPALLAEMIATVVLAKGRRTTRGYFKACCPAHDDQRPSLLIYVKADGRLSFRCLAGCPTKAIRMALRQRGFDLSRMKKQAAMQDGPKPAKFARTRDDRVPVGALHPDHG
jgi:hypothetical protein